MFYIKNGIFDFESENLSKHRPKWGEVERKYFYYSI